MVTKKKSKKKWIIIGIIVVAIILFAVSFFMRPALSDYENIKAKIGNITTYYSFSGNVDTKNRQTVVSDKVMQISSINVEEGDLVTKGDVLFKTTLGEEIKAKIDGEVANLKVEDNQQFLAGTQLMDIVDYDNLEVTVKVDEYDISALKTGKETTVTIGAVNKKIKGKIISMSNEGQTENGVTYFTATIDLKKDSKIKIGMTAEVTLLNSSVKGVVTLPMTVVQFDEDNNPYVLIKDKDGKAVKTAIKTGINDGTTVEIKSGVSEGEAILYTKADTTANMAFSRSSGNTGNASSTGSNGG
ncbi:MAG: HlyD family efflux transporter periplasmic adaptor subunit [Clostridia bacterium]|jgi:HlyD family secretion protein